MRHENNTIIQQTKKTLTQYVLGIACIYFDIYQAKAKHINISICFIKFILSAIDRFLTILLTRTTKVGEGHPYGFFSQLSFDM